MELQGQPRGDWSRHFYHQPPVEFCTRANHPLLCSELKISSVGLEDNSAPYHSLWTNTEQARAKSCNNRSFAMDARIRLDGLKSGCNSPWPCSAMDGMLHNYNCQKDNEESEGDESALDLVELLDLEDGVQDEESWLYESPKEQESVERTESAVRWCRHVLDNPSPEMEAACHLLRKRLDQRSSSHFYRRPMVFHHTGNVGSSMDRTAVGTARHTPDSLENDVLSSSHDSITSYRLQDITDVHVMARMQEASLRQDYVCTPATSSPRRGPESPVNTAIVNMDDFPTRNKTEASSSSCWQPGLLSLSSSPCPSPTSVAEHGRQSPKLVRLHQQVTQFKLLKLTQSQETSSGRTRSPLRTSLRSLQAVRSSRSLETDDCEAADQIYPPPTGASSFRKGLSCWPPSLSAASTNSNSLLHSVRDSSVRMKRLQKSQSVSPCRIPHPAKAYLSVNGRVFASPERSSTMAWARNVPPTQL